MTVHTGIRISWVQPVVSSLAACNSEQPMWWTEAAGHQNALVDEHSLTLRWTCIQVFSDISVWTCPRSMLRTPVSYNTKCYIGINLYYRYCHHQDCHCPHLQPCQKLAKSIYLPAYTGESSCSTRIDAEGWCSLGGSCLAELPSPVHRKERQNVLLWLQRLVKEGAGKKITGNCWHSLKYNW